MFRNVLAAFSQTSQMFDNVYVVLSLIPIISFFSVPVLSNYLCSFPAAVFILLAAYFAHTLRFDNRIINRCLKCIACIATSLLVVMLLLEMSHALLIVYYVPFGE